MSFAPSAQRDGLSGFTAASRTMTSTTPTSNGMIKGFVFGSEWFFKPYGVKSLLTRFEKELDNKQLTAEVQWNRDDHTFRMTCEWATSEQVWSIFFKTAQSLITQESAEGWNDDSNDDNESLVEDSDNGSQPAHSTKIQHLSEWKKENGIIDIIDDKDEEDTYQPRLGIDFPQKFKYYKSKTTWEYEGTNPSLDEIASDELLIQLAALVGCEFVKDLNQGKIYIGAASEEDCRRAVCKIDNIYKNLGMRYTYVNHLFYTEDIENYQVSFKRFVEVKKKFFETTLLDNLQLSTARFDYRNLPFAVTVRCSTFNAMKSHYIPFKMAKYHAAVSVNNKDSGSREWKDWNYSSYAAKGKDEVNSMTRFEGYKPRTEQANLPQQPQPSDQHDESEKSEKDVVQTQKLEEAASAQEETLHRWFVDQKLEAPAGSNGQLQEDNTRSNNRRKKASWDTYKPYTEERVGAWQKKIHVPNAQLSATISTLRCRAAEQSPQAPSTPLSDWTLPTYMPQMSHPTAPATPPKATVTKLLEDSPIKNMTPKITECNHINVETETLINFEDTSFKSLDENTSFFDAPASQPNDPFGSPIRALPGYPVPQFEKMQPYNEVGTRTYRSTMNQKAPKPSSKSASSGSKSYSFGSRLDRPSPPPVRQSAPIITIPVIDPIPEFIGDINMGFDELLQGLRGFQGELNVQAEFGRILLKGVPFKCITRGNSEASFEREYAQEVLSNPNGVPPTPIFTKVLTALPADISFLIGIKDCQGHAMWEQNQLEWVVLYEVICVDTRTARSRPFTIEIDAEKLYREPQVKVRHNFGAINVHGLKRHWDFRISATGIEVRDSVDSAYMDLAQAIKSSLHIPDGLRSPLLYFEVPEHLSSLLIFGVRVRRVNRYRSVDFKSVLAISEVRELKLELKGGEEGGSTLWKAIGCLDPSTMLGQDPHKYKWLYLWHEVCISCPKADEMFEQNKTLELGEETSWTPEKLSNIDTVQSMYRPACEMLKQMDGVGFYNDNEINVQVAQRSTASVKVEDPAPYYFW